MLFLLACASHPGAPAASPPIAAAPSDPPVPPGMISDETCIARGGHIETEADNPYARDGRDPDAPVAPYRICRIPSPANGHSCRDDADCQGGMCRCTGVLSGPLPNDPRPEIQALHGQPTTGECSDDGFMPGRWYCLVGDGKANLNGIIVD
jgi:hypothetical protein